jgi:hypothetical protein
MPILYYPRLGDIGQVRKTRSPGRRVHPAHMVVLDSRGYPYMDEAGNGRRMQRFKVKAAG